MYEKSIIHKKDIKTKINNSRNVYQSAILITIMMLIFKIIGFIKQAVIAYYYGATFETDIYFIAYGFVTGLSESIIKSISVSTLGIYTTIRIQKGQEKANQMISSLLGIVLPFSLIMVGILLVFSPFISKLLAPTFSNENLLLLTTFMRSLSFIFMFMGIELICSSILDSHQSYYIPRLQSLIYSIIVILCCKFLGEKLGIRALVLAQYTSSIIYIVLLIISVKRYIKLYFINPFSNNYIKRILLTALPLIFGNAVIQINQIVDRMIASVLSEGGVSALSYSHTLEQFVTNIMIVNVGNIFFSHFANLVAENKSSEITRTLKRTLEILLCILIPISIITIICAKDIVEMVYFRGSFTTSAVSLTSMVLIGYALAFPMIAIRDILTKSMYAYQDTKSPMMNSIISILVNIMCSIILSKYIGLLGVAIGTSISVYLGAFMNMKSFKKKNDFNYSFMLITLIKAIPASIGTIIVILLIKLFIPISNQYFSFMLVSICGLLVFYIIMLLEKAEEICILNHRLKNKFNNLIIKKG